MKYIEELESGDAFIVHDQYFILTMDFKKNGDKLAVCLSNGQQQWVKSSDMVNTIDLFTIDKNNLIIAIKERTKDAANTTPNIS